MLQPDFKKLFLVGKSLKHSFSKSYFDQKFDNPRFDQWSYNNFEIESIDKVVDLLKDENLIGFNVTLPYKHDIIPYLDDINPTAKKIGAVNTVVKTKGRFIGYNTDMPAFAKSLDGISFDRAIVLGTGGASKAVVFALKQLGKQVLQIGRQTDLSYDHLLKAHMLDNQLIVNCTPLGTAPDIDQKPNLPYQFIGKEQVLYDLVYNPETTAFMKEGTKRGAQVKSGLEMLKLQADMSLDLWKSLAD